MRGADALKLFGTTQPPVPFRLLRAGPLEVRFEAGNLRYVRYQGHEVLRAIAYVVRDRDWGTLVPALESLDIDEGPDRFGISYEARYENGGARLHVSTRIEGAASGTLTFAATATTYGGFETNRCGFNVLHPINGVAGAPVKVEHCDGSTEDTVFPDLIEPWQPFKSVRALTHAPAPHLEACCRMEGDVFEMEDQRNWSDASFKTYVRPLELPWPYRVAAGSRFEQTVRLTVAAKASAPPPGTYGPAKIRPVKETAATFPRVGLLVSPSDIAEALRHSALLKRVAPQALLCHLDPTAGHGMQALREYRSLQEVYPAIYDLEYVVHCKGDLDEEFQTLAQMVRESGLMLNSLAVCPSVDRQSTPPGNAWPDCPPLAEVYEAARRAFPDIVLGGGMFSYFTELNRKRPPVGLLDYVTHATNPIVHAADDLSVMETLETLPHITRSARAIIGEGKAYRLGPSTIGMRQNPYGSRTFDNPAQKRICMSHDDPRQRGLFAAAWTLGYAAAIAQAGIEQWVAASFAGPRGIVDADTGSFLPVGETVAQLARLSGRPVWRCDVTRPDRIAALCTGGDDGPEPMVCSLTADDIEIAGAEPVTLGPYEILRL
ncbi:MAG: hypothetical protein Tsb0019_30720 [Roseibium sp.]